VAPTWAYGTGWGFDGATQYLVSPALPGYPLSIVIRGQYPAADGGVWGAVGNGQQGVAVGTGGSTQDNSGTDIIGVNTGVAWADTNSAITTGANHVLAMIAPTSGAPLIFYLDGALVGSSWGGNTRNAPLGASYIGGHVDYFGVPNRFSNASIAALAIYSDALTAGEVAALTVSMNALPTAAGNPVAIIQQHHHAAVYGGVAVG